MMTAPRKNLEETPGTRTGSLSLNERLGLIGLIDEGMRLGSSGAPVAADLFGNLLNLVGETVRGSKIDRLKPEDGGNGFRVIEVNAESGENLGRLNMIYLRKPIPCYYLVYVEVSSPYRKQGLGHRILSNFRDFLVDKNAVGILDNIIPKDDATYDIYDKHGWEPIEQVAGESAPQDDHEYMVFLPPKFQNKDVNQALAKLIHHLRRKRAAIDMRDNELMVRVTIAEFRDLYDALTVYFEKELSAGDATPLMRFMFTRYVTKLIGFRRRIGELLGYTGGESLEQIRLDSDVAALPMQSYAPGELAGRPSRVFGDEAVWARLPDELLADPPRFIDGLPDYGRPSFHAWLRAKNRDPGERLTIGDLLDLGFDPTRLKEFELDGERLIFERIQARQLDDLVSQKELLERAAAGLPGAEAAKARLLVNRPLLAIRNRGNAYVLRKKVPGIHWEEAMDQIKESPPLKVLNASMNLDRMVRAAVRAAARRAAEIMDMEEGELRERLAFFVSWDLAANRPKMVVDYTGHYLEAVWLA